jgi:hypothetical protein
METPSASFGPFPESARNLLAALMYPAEWNTDPPPNTTDAQRADRQYALRPFSPRKRGEAAYAGTNVPRDGISGTSAEVTKILSGARNRWIPQDATASKASSPVFLIP